MASFFRICLGGVEKQMGIKKSIIVLIVVLFCSIPSAYSQQLDPEIAFAKAFDLFRQGNFKEAAQAYGWLFSEISSSGGSLAEQSAYMQLISTFNAGQYDETKILAEAYLARFPESERSADIQYQVARIAFAEKRYDDAIQLFTDFITQYELIEHLSEFVSQALFWRSESFYQLGSLTEAFSGFSALVEKYPDTSKKNEALQRIEIIGAESRERFQSRIIDFNLKESLQMQSRLEQSEKYTEQLLERYALLVRRLRSIYGLGQPGRLPLYANVLALTPTPAPPPPQVINAEQSQPVNPISNLEVARNNRLKKLLSAKQRVLSLLADRLLNYTGEVLK